MQKLEPESKSEVDPPVATAAVRGTEFGLKVRRQPSILEAVLTVKEGKVEFFNAFGKVEATTMTESIAKADEKPTEPRRLQSLKVFQLAGAHIWVTTTSRLTLPEAAERIVFPLGWAGLTVKDVAPPREGEAPAERGAAGALPSQVRVVRVMRDSPAERTRLQVGDVITALNRNLICKAAEVDAAIFVQPHRSVACDVLRGGQLRTILFITARPPDVPPLLNLPTSIERPLYEATRLLIEGKTDAAERALQQLLVSHPHAAVHNNLGVLYEMKDEMLQAIRHYQRAMAQTEPQVILVAFSLPPSRYIGRKGVGGEGLNQTALYYYNLGMALRNIGNVERAVEELETAMRLAPRWMKARRSLADLYTLLDRLEDALQVIESALHVNRPEHGRPRHCVCRKAVGWEEDIL